MKPGDELAAKELQRRRRFELSVHLLHLFKGLDAEILEELVPEVDRETGFRTQAILCLPIRNRSGRVFAVAQLLNRCDGKPFDEADQKRFEEFASPIGVILESWWRMQHGRGTA